MLKGKTLNTNSTIGIIAPASCEDENIIQEKIKDFSKLGFKIKLGKHLFDKYGYLAGTDCARAADINDMFLDDSIDGIICLRGGFGSIRVLPLLDKYIITSHPKFFCGYSDITLILNYISQLGLITFHGPMIKSNFSDTITLNSFKNIISCNSPNYVYNLNSYDNISYSNIHSFEGRLVGGNLSMICSAIGTPFEVNTKNSILLLEDVGEYPYAIDRMLSELILNNVFKNCNGIILGDFTNCTLHDLSKSFTVDEVLLNKLEPLNIPIIKGLPFGHNTSNLTLPIGCTAKFSAKNNLLTITENFLT